MTTLPLLSPRISALHGGITLLIKSVIEIRPGIFHLIR